MKYYTSAIAKMAINIEQTNMILVNLLTIHQIVFLNKIRDTLLHVAIIFQIYLKYKREYNNEYF